MIYTNIPFSPKETPGDLGHAYDKFMSRLEENDWACFLDHDAMFLHKDWYKTLEEVIESHKYDKSGNEYGIFTCYTNRVGNPNQIWAGASSNINYLTKSHDIRYHRELAENIAEQKLKVIPFRYIASTDPKKRNKLSGMMMLISKRAWNKIRTNSDAIKGFLGVDNRIHKAASDKGFGTGLINNLYVYHWYRDS